MHRHAEARNDTSRQLSAYRRPEAHPCRSPEAMDRLFRAADRFRRRK